MQLDRKVQPWVSQISDNDLTGAEEAIEIWAKDGAGSWVYTVQHAINFVPLSSPAPLRAGNLTA